MPGGCMSVMLHIAAYTFLLSIICHQAGYAAVAGMGYGMVPLIVIGAVVLNDEEEREVP